jgi:hypothetical protein
MSGGREFQKRAAVEKKERPPRVEQREKGTTRERVEDERSLERLGRSAT